MDELDHDRAAKLGIAREADHAHPAGAKRALDDIAPDDLAGCEAAIGRARYLGCVARIALCARPIGRRGCGPTTDQLDHVVVARVARAVRLAGVVAAAQRHGHRRSVRLGGGRGTQRALHRRRAVAVARWFGAHGARVPELHRDPSVGIRHQLAAGAARCLGHHGATCRADRAPVLDGRALRRLEPPESERARLIGRDARRGASCTRSRTGHTAIVARRPRGVNTAPSETARMPACRIRSPERCWAPIAWKARSARVRWGRCFAASTPA